MWSFSVSPLQQKDRIFLPKHDEPLTFLIRKIAFTFGLIPFEKGKNPHPYPSSYE